MFSLQYLRFGGIHVDGGSADINRVVDEVSANRPANALGFSFLWAMVNHDAQVYGGAAGW